VGDLRGKPSKELLATGSNAAYAEPGYLLYVDNSTLMAQPFDADRLELRGDAAAIVEGIYYAGGALGSDFSVSPNGMLVYSSDRDQNLVLKWFERGSRAVGSVGAPGNLSGPHAISADGNRIAFSRREREGADIWLHDVARSTDSRFTCERGDESSPVWSPDGVYIVYMHSGQQWYRKRSDGIAAAEPLGVKQILRPTDWSRNGKYILGDTPNSFNTQNDLWLLPMFGEQKVVSFLQTEFSEVNGKFSPDGDWVAYMSNRTGRAEVYLVSFPDRKRTHLVSVSGGDRPNWSRDGREIYYMGLDGTIWAAAVKGSGPSLTSEAPKPLFRAPGMVTVRFFDVAKDGRFLIPVPEENSAAASSITLIQNWTALLHSKTP